MVHRKHRPDINRDEIVEELEKRGWQVVNLGNCGEGVPDLLIARKTYFGCNDWIVRFIEIKSEKGTYTPKELKFQERFSGLVITLRKPEDVEKL